MTAARRTAFAMALTAALAASAAAQAKRVTAADSWVKLPSPGETQAMAFVAIENPTMYGIYVTSAKADVAGKVELRDGSQGGAARLMPVEFIGVPAYERVDMGPEGPYLLLVGLRQALKEGDKVALSLSTDNAGTLEVSAVVRK